VYAYTTWQDGQGHTIGRGSDSRIEGLDGDCAPPPPAKVKPGPPMVKDLCETANDHYGLPEPTEGIAYSRDGLNLVAELTSDEYELDLSDTGWVADDDGTATYYFDEEDFTDINCEEVVPIPALFAAAPTPPTCDAAGALPNLAAAQHVTVTVSPAFDGPGTYTIVADTDEGYEFPDGTTHKQIVLTVLGATGYQSENPTAPCFRAVLPAPAAPEFTDECGTADDGYSIPEDTEDYYYEVSEDGGSVFVEAFAVAEEDVFPEGTVTQWEFTFTDEPCATPTPTPLPAAPAALPATGGVDMTPWGIGAAVMLLAGAALLASRRLARR
jgi:LPXTG-motif cell wall-anchored protein